jgi:glycosyltransferase involved in cell wall biosynthesis
VKIAIFDYLVTSGNPAGSCHRFLIEALACEHDFTVFSNELYAPAPESVRWMPVPAIRRPLALLFLTFHITACLSYLRACWRRETFALIQSVESNFAFADVVYSHFCHRWFLRHHWAKCRAGGLRGLLGWLDHALHALTEPWVLRRARWIVVPSQGLKHELSLEYPFAAGKISVIPNPVDLESFQRPRDFDPRVIRRQLGILAKELMVVFVALGHFERKGLPLLLEAMASVRKGPWKLVVVGGSPQMILEYQKRAATLGLMDRIRFVGFQEDIRPFLWSSDLFAMPSRYETFFLAALQAVAASCPVLITRLNGVEEYLDSSNALIVDSEVTSIVSALERFRSQSPPEREAMAMAALRSARACGRDEFALAWRMFYRRVGQAITNA